MDSGLRKLFLAHLDFDLEPAEHGAFQPNPEHWRSVVARWFDFDRSGAFSHNRFGRQPIAPAQSLLPAGW